MSFGPFRLPSDFFKRMAKQLPDERLFAGALDTVDGMVSYPRALEREMTDFLTAELEDRLSPELLFPCVIESPQRGETCSP